MVRLSGLFSAFLYSFPVQLLINNFKRNQILLLCWAVLFAMITGNFGKYLGIPYLFLDPEYLNEVNFTSFAFMGLLVYGFTAAFHITCYISDGHHFSFVGAMSRPFRKFSLNNSLLPTTFLITYLYQVISFQVNNEYTTGTELALDLAGFATGYLAMAFLLQLYFRYTQKDIFKYMVCRLDEKIKQTVKVTRASAMNKLDIAKKKQARVDYYLDTDFRFKKVMDEKDFYDKGAILQVFDQNQFNLVIIELLIFGMVLVLGIFKDYPAFQVPAAASFMIFLTIFVMLSGAFSYWFGSWSITMSLALFLMVNFLIGEGWLTKKYQAFGLNYNAPPVTYTVDHLQHLNDSTHINQAREHTLQILENWKAKFKPGEKRKMVFVCTSGGGKRAALWTLATLQQADSLTGGKLMDQTMLITGASGGLIGASYFREVILRQKQGQEVHPYSALHQRKIATDNLNPLIFSLLANDLFVGLTKFEYQGQRYSRDRGYTFEEQLNIDTENFMDKTLTDYREPEMKATVPMIIFSPTIINDGRKLYISPQPVSFLNSEILNFPTYNNPKLSGIDFQQLFAEHGGSNLRFLSALRMSATFPYITPNTTLPTAPPIQIMDAGISDNFGISDAVRFIYSFREWIAENTDGIVIVSIRDSPKLSPIAEQQGNTLIDDITQPIASVYNNFENFQDITNDNLVGYARSWFKGSIDRVDIQYMPTSYVPILQKMDSIRQHNARASLSWRLTTREKQGVVETLSTQPNQEALKKLQDIIK
ncbi:MAG TPA: patatin-like phospholipase family protein [Cyclobacteriaceae bacterium]|nr:patatin-like phospholipase family protein [Cyclobacteriaceae bacterium]